MGKAKLTILEISIPQNKIGRTGGVSFGKIGHDLTLQATLSVSRRSLGPLSGEGIDCPELEWKETIDWFVLTDSNTWQEAADEPGRGLRNKTTTDCYAKNPASNTFQVWGKARYFIASDNTNNPPEELKDAVKAQGENASLEKKDKLAKHWIAQNGFQWTVRVTDRPALGLKPEPGSRGGAGESLVTSKSRRRVIYFDLGFKGSPARVTATQVLETVNGLPTIHKFFVPGIDRTVANNDINLARWRTQINENPQTFVP